MTSNSARLIGLSSFLLLALVGLNLSALSSKSVSPKVASNNQGQVLTESTGSYLYKFYLKDASVLGAVLPGNTEENSYLKGATVIVLNTASFHCGGDGANYTFEESNGLYKLTCQESGTLSIRISKSGYNTKTTSLTPYQGEIPTLTLTKYVAPPPPPPPPPPETIKDITLPSVFKEEGSKTTDLKQVADTSKVENLTLDTKKATIQFKEPVNLSSTEAKDKFKTLDQFVKLDKTAVVSVNSQELKELNKKASITMKALPWVKTPKILVDGKEDKSVVSNIKYEKGVLSFDTEHFSTFTAAPTISLDEPKKDFKTGKDVIKIAGLVSDPTAVVTVIFNGDDQGQVKVEKATGKFKHLVEAKKGENKIVVNAVSENGATASAQVNGVFEETNIFMYLLLGVLALVGLFGLGFAGYKLQRARKREKQLKLV